MMIIIYIDSKVSVVSDEYKLREDGDARHSGHHHWAQPGSNEAEKNAIEILSSYKSSVWGNTQQTRPNAR